MNTAARFVRRIPCPAGQLKPASDAALQQIGLSPEALAKLTIALDILIVTAFTICAIVIYVRKPNDLFTIFVSIMLVTFGAATFTGGIRGVILALSQARPAR